MYLDINETKFGYILQDKTKNTKYVLNASKKPADPNSKTAPFYLKQVAPQEKYISGMLVKVRDHYSSLIYMKMKSGYILYMVLD